ncbi:MAG: zinc-dependent peptidase [Halothiobacillaceae bacterium]
MFSKILSSFGRRPPARLALDDALWHEVVVAVPLLAARPPEERQGLREMVERFLARKGFFGGDGFEPTLPMAVQVAALACLPVLHLGDHWLDAVFEVVLYPDQFVPTIEHIDEFGLVHEETEARSGEAWEHGTLVLSWPDVEASGRMEEGYNVVIHEIAHVLDMRNGAFNGFPPIPVNMDAGRWTADFTEAFEALNRAIDAGETPAIDPYAASAPTEFFAVASEYHFERPDILRAAFPRVAAQLARFYAGGGLVA